MGKQLLPIHIEEMDSVGQKLDAARLYASLPKRVIFDTLWDVIGRLSDDDGDGPMDDAGILGAIAGHSRHWYRYGRRNRS